MIVASFNVVVTEADTMRFADLSGDWNPLHTDIAYAATTNYRRPILHGAYSAGLISRMAGMYIPGRDCLLRSMRLNFVDPILTPANLRVTGKLVREHAGTGLVQVTVEDADTGRRHVEASYEFGRHTVIGQRTSASVEGAVCNAVKDQMPRVLVTGATGGLGSALLSRLGPTAIGVSRSGNGISMFEDLQRLDAALGDSSIGGIVHCGWPKPDNTRLIALGAATSMAIQHNVSEPLEQMVALAQLLSRRGVDGAALVLVGSTFAMPGRHAFRTPLYGLAKSLIPRLSDVLALELGAQGRRCISVVFDVIKGNGMNTGISPATAQAHADRSPFGELITANEAADQIVWLLGNSSRFMSGGLISLSGGALP